MPDLLPIRKLVLYKHGIGSLTRQGQVPGRELSLTLQPGEIDDVLKSLVALPLDGGQVTGIQYETPIDPSERFEEIPLSLGEKHSLFDLLRDVRGSAVTVSLEGGAELHGRVVGLETHPQGREHGATLALLTDDAAVEQVASDRIRAIRLADQPAARLRRYLDASQSQEDTRTVRIALTEPDRRVQVSYTIPFPVWRVCYRLVGESAGSGRQALLQTWGIVDNRLDEDLEDVEVSLIAGRPISFRYDLSSSVIPERVFVPDETRTGGPVELEGVAGPRARSLEAPDFDSMPQMAAPREPSWGKLRKISTEDVASATLQSVEGREREELYEYQAGGVSVGRGQSVMIPLAQRTADYRRELLYNGARLPRHPVVYLRLRNETGLTLERGPVTILEDGEYRGEAILPFTTAGAEIGLACAVEQGVIVREESSDSTTTVGLELRGAYLRLQEQLTHRTTYHVVNRTDREQIVTVEQAVRPGTELTDTRAPDEESFPNRRWRIPCPAHAETSFRVTERTLLSRREAVLDQRLTALSGYLERRFLDTETRQRLEGILRLRQALTVLDERQGGLRTERQSLAERAERNRKNLSIQATTEAEREIRRRSAEEIRSAQDREAEIDHEEEDLQTERQRTERRLEEELKSYA